MKFTIVVTGIALIILVVNAFLFFNVNDLLGRIDEIYDSNLQLNELSATLDNVRVSMSEYLNTKSTESMEDYYRYEQDLRDMLEELNGEPVNDSLLMAEKNIKNLTEPNPSKN